MQTLAAVAVVFCILVFAEYLARSKAIHAELTRKIVHMSVGTFVAFWPLFLSWRAIELLSVAFLIVVSISIRLNLLRSIHGVQRRIVGELLFAASIGILALISSSKWIFMAAMLNLSLADGAAAVVGTLWGDTNQYRVLGRPKSRAGSSAFFVTSLLILFLYAGLSHAPLNPVQYVLVPLIATGVENVAVYGTDNMLVPLAMALLLSSSV